jgi:hypothetical protein
MTDNKPQYRSQSDQKNRIGHALFVNGPVDDLKELTNEVDADLVEVVDPVG